MRSTELVRLTEIPVPALLELFSDPLVARHMPLADEFGAPAVERWVHDKDAQWERNGIGPWGILIDGEVAGWGGFQLEDDAADLALVLFPRFWGAGSDIARMLIRGGFEDFGLDRVTVALPRSRDGQRVLPRLGFRPIGEVVEGGVPFDRFELSRAEWRARSGAG